MIVPFVVNRTTKGLKLVLNKLYIYPSEHNYKHMKRLLLCFFLIQMIAYTSWGQLTIHPTSFVLTGNPSENDVNMHIEVTNNQSFDAYILWSRVVESAPSGWLTWICDKNLCYLPTANACAPNKPNILAPGEKMDLQIHVNPAALKEALLMSLLLRIMRTRPLYLVLCQGSDHQ